MNVRCKFRCDSVTHRGTAEEPIFDYALFPVASATGENAEFWKWTPAGKLELQGIKQDLHFEPGQEYYLDITAAAPSEDH